MQVVPDYSFDDAPLPRVVVVPEQGGDSPTLMGWLRRMAGRSDVVMSVCTGAFKLGAAGLLSGKKATTHHEAYRRFANRFPDVLLQKNMRFVQSDPVIFTSGGLTAGMDLALHVVDLYFGRGVAEATARHMEYEASGWTGDGTSGVAYFAPAGPHPSDRFHSGVLGNWQGRLTTSEGSFQVAVHIWPDAKGNLIGTVDSIDEDVNGLVIEGISLNAPALHFEVPIIGGVYDGSLAAEGSRIAGAWTQRGASTPLVLQRAAQ